MSGSARAEGGGDGEAQRHAVDAAGADDLALRRGQVRGNSGRPLEGVQSTPHKSLATRQGHTGWGVLGRARTMTDSGAAYMTMLKTIASEPIAFVASGPGEGSRQLLVRLGAARCEEPAQTAGRAAERSPAALQMWCHDC